MTPFGWLQEVKKKLAGRGGRGRGTPARRVAAFRPCLERLEDRLALIADFVFTTTNVAVSITPHLLTLTATETVTATVTMLPFNTPVTLGSVGFNVNNRQATVPLDSNGQASFTVTMPLFAVGTNQTLQVTYLGASPSPPTDINPTFLDQSGILAPLYLNRWNEFFPSKITYGPQQPAGSAPSFLTPFSSASGETDAVLFGLVQLNYVDPGLIQSVNIGGLVLPGSAASLFAIEALTHGQVHAGE